MPRLRARQGRARSTRTSPRDALCGGRRAGDGEGCGFDRRGTSVHASLFGGAPVLGPDIERVVRNAPCPVLCVPSGRVVTPVAALVTEPIPQMQ